MSKFCMECGVELPDSAKFCYSCGAKCISVIPEKGNVAHDIIEDKAQERPLIQKKIRRKAQVSTPPAKSFFIAGNKISFSQDFLEFNDILSFFNRCGFEEREKFRKFRKANIKSFEDFEEKVPSYMEDVIVRSVDEASKLFKRYGSPEMSEAEYTALCAKAFDLNEYLDCYNEVIENHERLVSGIDNPQNYGSAIKGSWIGGGFGIAGAVKGTVKASLMNVGLSIINEAIATAGQATNIRSIVEYEAAVLQDPKLQKGLEVCADNCFHAGFFGMLRVFQVAGKAPDFLFDFDSLDEEVGEAMDACMVADGDGAEGVARLCKCLQKYPYYSDVLLRIHEVVYDEKTTAEINELAAFLGIDGDYHEMLRENATNDISLLLDRPLENSTSLTELIQLLTNRWYRHDQIDGLSELLDMLQKSEKKMVQEEEAARAKAEKEKVLADEKERQIREIYDLLDRARAVFTDLRNLPLGDEKIAKLWKKVAVPNKNMLIEGFLSGFYYAKYYDLERTGAFKSAIIRELDNLYMCGYPHARFIKLFIKANELAEENYKVFWDGGFKASRLKKKIARVNEDIAYECKKIWEETSLIQAGLYYYATIHAESSQSFRNDYFTLLNIAAGQYFPPAMITLALYHRYHNCVDDKYRKNALKEDEELSLKFEIWTSASGDYAAANNICVSRKDIAWYSHFYGPDAY